MFKGGAFMNFAICDDNPIEIKPITDHLHASGHEVDLYESGEALVRAYRDEGQRYDALFLDLEMAGINGFETTNVVRAIDDTVLIVYVTSHHVLAQECFAYDPVWFIYKPVDLTILDRAVEKIAALLAARRYTYTFRDSHQSVRLRCEDILYIEAMNHNVTIHTKTGRSYTIRKSLKDIEQELGDSFCRIHASYLVNLQYLAYFGRDPKSGKDIAQLEHLDMLLPVGRAYKQNANALFLQFQLNGKK